MALLDLTFNFNLCHDPLARCSSWTPRGSSKALTLECHHRWEGTDLQVAPALGIPGPSLSVQRPGVRSGSGLTLRGPQLLHDALGRSLLGPRAGLQYLVAAARLAEHVWGLQRRLPLGRQIQVLLRQVRAQLPDLKLQEAKRRVAGGRAIQGGSGVAPEEGQGPAPGWQTRVWG